MTLDGTNTWVLRLPELDGCLVVDPGPLDEAHLAAVAAHAPIAGVLVTHGHPDHTEGLARFLELTGAPVIQAAPGIQRIPTPGHTADSVSYLVRETKSPAVLSGDTVLGSGTTVVAHPDGDLGDYLASLDRLARLGPVTVLPGHGPPLADCAAAASFYRGHRLARLAQVRDLVAAGATTPAQIVAAAYADVDRVLWPAAELSVRAALGHLERLAEEQETEPGSVRLDTP
ncbi:MAG: MBL fold metallo-hydrolase [Micromonosporaceae bacterium]|nr:MBL fold metallo-hydrolase [Micromonosporaceae bacterium]